VYFNVNLKLLTKLINSAFVGECVNWVTYFFSLSVILSFQQRENIWVDKPDTLLRRRRQRIWVWKSYETSTW